MKGHNTGGYYQCLMYVGLRTFDTLHKNPRRIGTGLRIMLGHELRRITIPRTPVNSVGGRRDLPPAQSGFIAPFCALGYYVSYLVELGEERCKGFGSGWRSQRVPVWLRLRSALVVYWLSSSSLLPPSSSAGLVPPWIPYIFGWASGPL